MPYYGSADITKSGPLPQTFSNQTHICGHNMGASAHVEQILIYSHFWWGSGALWLQAWKTGYDGRSAGYAEFQPRGVTNSAAGGMSVPTMYNHEIPTPYWGGYGGTSPGRNCILSYQGGQYNSYVWKLVQVNTGYRETAAEVDNTNGVHMYSATKQWG